MLLNTKLIRTLIRLHNGEHVGLGEEFIEHIKPDVEYLPLAKADWDKYESAVILEYVMYNQSPESPETKAIAEFDVQRGRYWGEMIHKLKFDEKNLNENIRRAAVHLLFIMRKYGDVPGSNLFEETTSMRSALAELKETENRAATALINGFDELILEAEAINEELHTLYDKRLKDKEKVKELGKLVDFRKVVDKLLIRFLESVNAIERVNELGVQDPTVQAAAERIRLQLTALIAQLLLILNRRKSKTGGGEESPEDGTTNPDFEEQTRRHGNAEV